MAGMDYYKLFNLNREPFSSTPDPDFFYRSAMHAKCLMDLEIALRLRRGLIVVQGEVGTGKTTLCRRLIRTLSADNGKSGPVRVHLVLDPAFESALQFAKAVNSMLSGAGEAEKCQSIGCHREMIKNRLFAAGVGGDEIVVLVIDEAQKLPGECIEFLRELLNYETNEHKLLQIVLFAQNEMKALLAAHPNFEDRVAFYHLLGPLDRADTQHMIRFRLERAADGTGGNAPFFTKGAFSRIHRLTGGYPRKIIHLSHNILLLLLIKGKSRVTPAMVDQAAKSVPSIKMRAAHADTRYRRTAVASVCMAACVLLVAGFVYFYASSAPDWLSLPLSAEVQEGPDATEARAGRQADSPALPFDETDRAGDFDEKPAGPDQKNLADAGGMDEISPAARAESGQPESEIDRIEPPDVLGVIRIGAGESLWRMLPQIYGAGGRRLLSAVVEANPDINSPDVIRQGQAIRLPAAGLRMPEPGERYWIALEKAPELEPAYRFYRALESDEFRIISFWAPSEGFVHAVVWEKAFGDRKAARDAMDAMPAETRLDAWIMDMDRPGVKMAGTW